jgi:putative PIN family toxin of toxin-antitoxin system
MTSHKVVLDTNVLVSALLNPFGAPAKLLDLVLAGTLHIVLDDRILSEWQQVLERPKFGFSRQDIDALLEFVAQEAERISATGCAGLPDPDDAPFLEVALASGAALITGNLRHYPEEGRQGAVVMGPSQFLQLWAPGER